MNTRLRRVMIVLMLLAPAHPAVALERVPYNHPGLVVDLGVGLWAWPLPMDWDGDGDLDLVVSCPDVPFRGMYLFENPGGGGKMPVFKPPVKVGEAYTNIRVSYVEGKPRVLSPGKEWTDFPQRGFTNSKNIRVDKIDLGSGRVRANQWQVADYDGDGALDLYIGIGFWGDYGWDNAFDKNGNWTRGPLHGWVYLARNRGTTKDPEYEKPVKLNAGGKPVDVYGMPSPNLADFDGDGDLDLLCGEFLDGFVYFRNVGSRTQPRYEAGRRLAHQGKPLAMNVQMITPTAIDWDRDGDIDIVVGDEDGRVALVENTGRREDGFPSFLPPVYFQQEARDLKFGALATPVSFDWDGDGDEDLVCGNTAGHIGFFENLDGGNPPKWAAPKRLRAGGEVLRIQAGPNGSIQGPCEAKWGYTTLSIADWDHDTLPDLVVNSIWGKVVWYRNVGTREQPKLEAARPIEVAWTGPPPKPAWNWWSPEGKELVTQWRTTPVVVDWNKDGLNDLVMLDHEGYLAFFRRERRDGRLLLHPGERIFYKDGSPLRMNAKTAGGSGRRKLCVVDWDGDGRLDLLANSQNVNLFRNTGERDGHVTFEDLGKAHGRRLAGHTTSPTTVDWDGAGKRDLLVGAEDGRLYFLKHDEAFTGRSSVSLGPVSTLRQAGLNIQVHRADFQPFKNGGVAFGNRNYTWFDVPPKLEGWTFTRTFGGEAATISVTAERDGEVYMATATSQKSLNLSDWRKIQGLGFGYTDKGRTRMQVYRRSVKAGERIDVPQGNWTGGICLLAPDEKQALQNEEPRGNPKGALNVLFIAVDDLRVELGCYGDTIVKSPNIDGLAKRGMLFNRAYCQQAVCNPSRASILTGLRPETLGIWDLPTHFRARRPNVVTLPQHFRRNGYFTQNIGKIFHNWRQEGYQGDSVSWSVPAVMHYGTHGSDKAQVDGDVPPDLSGVPRTEMRDVSDNAYFDGRIADLAVDALRELKDQTFFLAVGFWKPHAPFNAPKKYWDLYDRSNIRPPVNPEAPKDVPHIALHDSREILRGFAKRPNGKPTAEDVLALRHGYYAAISYLDAQVGKVVDELDRLGLAEKTIIVFWSDHGFHLGEHALWAKTSNFELDARVPLIIVPPGRRARAGQTTDALVELLDLYPTLADLCGLEVPKAVEGVTLRPLLEGAAISVKQAAFTWHPRPAYPDAGKDPDAMGYSMRTDRYRYTEWRDFKTGAVVAVELYDHKEDPRETANLAKRPEHAVTMTRLGKQLGAAVAERASRGMPR